MRPTPALLTAMRPIGNATHGDAWLRGPTGGEVHGSAVSGRCGPIVVTLVAYARRATLLHCAQPMTHGFGLHKHGAGRT